MVRLTIIILTTTISSEKKLYKQIAASLDDDKKIGTDEFTKFLRETQGEGSRWCPFSYDFASGQNGYSLTVRAFYSKL